MGRVHAVAAIGEVITSSSIHRYISLSAFLACGLFLFVFLCARLIGLYLIACAAEKSQPTVVFVADPSIDLATLIETQLKSSSFVRLQLLALPKSTYFFHHSVAVHKPARIELEAVTFSSGMFMSCWAGVNEDLSITPVPHADNRFCDVTFVAESKHEVPFVAHATLMVCLRKIRFKQALRIHTNGTGLNMPFGLPPSAALGDGKGGMMIPFPLMDADTPAPW